MSRYRLEKQSDLPDAVEHDEWWSLGLWPDLDSLVKFMGLYDSDGNIALRIWDTQQDEVVPVMMLALYQPDPKVDWINDGF